MLFTIIIIAVCLALLYRYHLACRRLKADNQALREKAIKESRRYEDSHRAAVDSIKQAAFAMGDVEQVIRQWNDAPEYATAHPEVVHRLADVHAQLSKLLTNWMAFLHGQYKSGISDEMYMRLYGPNMEDDSLLRALYKKMGTPLPVRGMYFDRASGKVLPTGTFPPPGRGRGARYDVAR